MNRRRGYPSLVGLVVSVSASGAIAQPSDTVTAEALFQEGRALLEANKFVEACPKLAESQRIDPATGTLMALAMCHEGEGKLASAWAEFTDVAGRARREGREDRQHLAERRAAALRPRLSTLEIVVDPTVGATKGLEIRRNDVVLGAGVWNVAVPIDGGSYQLAASAPGRQSWSSVITVKGEGDRARVVVPELGTDVPLPTTTPAAPIVKPAETPVTVERVSRRPWGTLEWAGIGVAAGGVVALGVGGFFLTTALGEKADSNRTGDPEYCRADGRCGPKGLAERDAAVKHGSMATVLGVGGAVLLASGAAMFIVGRSSGAEEESGTTVGLAVAASPAGAVVGARGSF